MKKLADISAFESLQNTQSIECVVYNTPDAGKPTCKLVGEDGNIFNLIGIAARCLRRAHQADKAKEMTDRVMTSGSYDAALRIIMEYVDVE